MEKLEVESTTIALIYKHLCYSFYMHNESNPARKNTKIGHENSDADTSPPLPTPAVHHPKVYPLS